MSPIAEFTCVTATGAFELDAGGGASQDLEPPNVAAATMPYRNSEIGRHEVRRAGKADLNALMWSFVACYFAGSRRATRSRRR